MKCDIKNKTITQPPFKGAHLLIKVVQKEQKGTDTKKQDKLESESPAMKAKSEVPKERTSEGDTHMRNENGTLRTRTRVIKKPNRYGDGVM